MCSDFALLHGHIVETCHQRVGKARRLPVLKNSGLRCLAYQLKHVSYDEGPRCFWRLMCQRLCTTYLETGNQVITYHILAVAYAVKIPGSGRPRFLGQIGYDFKLCEVKLRFSRTVGTLR